MAIGALIDSHLSHREAEENALLAIVRSSLQPLDLTSIDEAMARRRHLGWAQLNGGPR